MSVRSFFKNSVFSPWLSLLLVAVPTGCGSDSGDSETPHTSNPGDGDGDGDQQPDDNGQGHSDAGAVGDGDDQGDGDGPGDGDGDGDAPLTSVSAADFCTTLTGLLCKAEQKCCDSRGSLYESVDACVQAENASCLKDIQPAALDARTGYSATTAAQKLNALSTKLVSCDLDIGEWLVASDGLVGIFAGTVGSGGDCTPHDANDAAALLSCQGGAVCQVTAFPLLSGKCGAEKGANDSCVSELECADGLRCDPPKSLTGQCKARLGDGQTCTDNADCESLVCSHGSCTARSLDTVYCLKAT
jgi:hypothetical protein